MKRSPHYLMQNFTFDHLPRHLQIASKPFCNLAEFIDQNIPENPEKTTALRKLLEAKDCAVRAVRFEWPKKVEAPRLPDGIIVFDDNGHEVNIEIDEPLSPISRSQKKRIEKMKEDTAPEGFAIDKDGVLYKLALDAEVGF